jgi:hypothetical protein
MDVRAEAGSAAPWRAAGIERLPFTLSALRTAYAAGLRPGDP